MRLLIFQPLIDLLCNIIVTALTAVNLVTIPANGIQAIATVASYGNYIVGADLMLVFASMVLGWMTLKMTVGLILFIWRLLPFT